MAEKQGENAYTTLEVRDMWESDGEDAYETKGGYLAVEASDDDFLDENEEKDSMGRRLR